MKKLFFKASLVALVAAVLTSCLGDNENTFSGTREFAVINTTTGGLKYAASASGSSGMYVTWDGVSSYGVGDVVLLTYKVSSNGSIGGSGDITIVKAEYGDVAQEDWYPASDHKNIGVQVLDTVNTPKSAYFNGFGVTNYSSNNFFSDKWLLLYAANVKDGEPVNATFYYDETKQTTKDGSALPANAAIVDVVLTKSGTAMDGAAAKAESKSIVVDMSRLRSQLRPSSGSSESTAVSVWFRMKKKKANSDSAYEWDYQQNAGYLYYDGAK